MAACCGGGFWFWLGVVGVWLFDWYFGCLLLLAVVLCFGFWFGFYLLCLCLIVL